MSLLARLREVPPRDIAICLGKKVHYSVLARRYRFDPWHARSPFECRPYKREVVGLVDALRPEVALEVGCGLGEIISRVDCPHRFGFDIDAAVIPAARHLHGDRGRFEVAGIGDAQTIRRTVDRSGGADVLVMVNWAHALAWAELSGHLRALTAAWPIRHLVMDTIVAGTPGYGHHHTAAQLGELGSMIKDIASSDRVRRLHVVELFAR